MEHNDHCLYSVRMYVRICYVMYTCMYVCEQLQLMMSTRGAGSVVMRCALFLQVFVHYLFQAVRVVAITLVSAVSTPGHRDDGIHFLSFLLNDLVVLLEYFMAESGLNGLASNKVFT